MKKSIVLFMMILLSASLSPTYAAATASDPMSITIDPNKNPELPARVKTLLTRVDEIRAMDKSTLTRVERKELRKELRSINSELKASGNGVYLSIGAIIIIVLLLILLL
ncbi:MAG TPA: hypothetical protein VF581_08220 [Flavobacterium sp.]|jgi:hypothetical protein